jgi:hypothetical protein
MNRKFAAHDKGIEAHRKGIVSLYSAIENQMPTLTGRQIGCKGKDAGKVTDKPKSAPSVRP